jgi:hypothetical protein
MSNVFELFKQKKIEDPSGPKTIVTITVVDILASSAQLARTVKELSMHFEAVDRVIDAINDTDTRNRLKLVTKLGRGRLTNATFEFFQAIRKVAEATNQEQLDNSVAGSCCKVR